MGRVDEVEQDGHLGGVITAGAKLGGGVGEVFRSVEKEALVGVFERADGVLGEAAPGKAGGVDAT